ncbi:MAG TPA: hypothetical protein VK335_26240 [Bryobacteraceae bacterium]|nr:hypothetical protein [Bryobacteraceae bacterium]
MRHPWMAALYLGISTCACWAQQQIVIDAQASTSPFPHFWEEAFGSGRAILTLRESYRNDLVAVKQATDFPLRPLPRYLSR